MSGVDECGVEISQDLFCSASCVRPHRRQRIRHAQNCERHECPLVLKHRALAAPTATTPVPSCPSRSVRNTNFPRAARDESRKLALCGSAPAQSETNATRLAATENNRTCCASKSAVQPSTRLSSACCPRPAGTLNKQRFRHAHDKKSFQKRLEQFHFRQATGARDARRTPSHHDRDVRLRTVA